MDAVPWIVTTVYATPDETGTFQDDYGFRLQCAKLCGVFQKSLLTKAAMTASDIATI